MTSPVGRRIPTYGGHLKVQVSGQLGPATQPWEIFSYSLSLAKAGAQVTEPAYLNRVIDAVLAFHGRPATGLSQWARITEVKIAQVLPDGKWLGAAPLLRRAVFQNGGNAGVGTFLVHAPQVSMVTTLRSALPGPRGRGRFYLPLPMWGSEHKDGLLTTTDAQTTAGSVVQLLNVINNVNGVANATGGTADNLMRVVIPSTWGPVSVVNRVQVGRVLDTIRSRRNNLREVYETAPGLVS